MKSVDLPFMGWIDHLPEVGDPIRDGRAKLLALADEAAELERKAAGLRGQMYAGQVELLAKVMQRWTLSDIQDAADAANRASPLAHSCAQVEDDGLRARLQQLDGRQLASEALQLFEAAGVIRHDKLLTAASEQ